MRIVHIDTTVLSGGASPVSESLALILVPDGLDATGQVVLDPDGVDRFRRYSSVAAVETDFGATSPASLAAGAYFRQSGGPADLLIGRWNLTAARGITSGGTVTGTAGSGIFGAGAKITLDGTNLNIPFVSGDNTFVKVAARFETAVAAVVGGTNVAYVDNRFAITWGTGDHVITEGASTDAAGPMGLTAETAGYRVIRAVAAETIADAASALRELSPDWRWISHAYGANRAADTAASKALITWATNQDSVACIVEGRDPSEALAVDTASVSRAAFTARSDNVACIATKRADHKAISIIGAMSGVNYSAADSVRTAALQTLSGCTPDIWTETEIARLDAKRSNYYVTEHGVGIVFPGVTTGETLQYIDASAWIHWFSGALDRELFNEVRRRRVPQTSEGIARLAGAIGRAAEVGVTNGGIAENTQLGTAGTQTLRRLAVDDDLTGLLPQGYAIFSGALSAARGRQTPPLYLLTKYTGAFHTVDLQLIVET